MPSKASEWAKRDEMVRKCIQTLDRPQFTVKNGTGDDLGAAWATNIGGTTFLDINGHGRFSADDALRLARWILDTFSEEPSGAPR